MHAKEIRCASRLGWAVGSSDTPKYIILPLSHNAVGIRGSEQLSSSLVVLHLRCEIQIVLHLMSDEERRETILLVVLDHCRTRAPATYSGNFYLRHDTACRVSRV